MQSEKNPQIEQQRVQISQLINDFEPYRKEVSKIDDELKKVEQRFEQLKQSSSNNLVAEQQQLIDWLTNAKNTMLSRIQHQQEMMKQEQALEKFNATRQQAQTELINKRMAEIYKTLGKGNVYQQIEDEMNYGGFGR